MALIGASAGWRVLMRPNAMALALAELGLDGRALYVERATMANQKIVPLDQVDPQSSPYFSLIIVPGEKWQG